MAVGVVESNTLCLKKGTERRSARGGREKKSLACFTGIHIPKSKREQVIATARINTFSTNSLGPRSYLEYVSSYRTVPISFASLKAKLNAVERLRG